MPKNTLEPFKRFCRIYKSAKKGNTSFRITRQLLQSAWSKGKKIGKMVQIVLTIPANKQENYIIEGFLTKEPK